MEPDGSREFDRSGYDRDRTSMGGDEKGSTESGRSLDEIFGELIRAVLLEGVDSGTAGSTRAMAVEVYHDLALPGMSQQLDLAVASDSVVAPGDPVSSASPNDTAAPTEPVTGPALELDPSRAEASVGAEATTPALSRAEVYGDVAGDALWQVSILLPDIEPTTKALGHAIHRWSRSRASWSAIVVLIFATAVVAGALVVRGTTTSRRNQVARKVLTVPTAPPATVASATVAPPSVTVTLVTDIPAPPAVPSATTPETPSPVPAPAYGSGTVAAGASGAWQIIGDPALTVTANQALDLAVSIDNITVSLAQYYTNNNVNGMGNLLPSTPADQLHARGRWSLTEMELELRRRVAHLSRHDHRTELCQRPLLLLHYRPDRLNG